MGIDGFSMSNLGLNRNLTSAQLAHEVDIVANQALENQIADVDGVGKKEKAGKKDPDAAFNGTVPFIADEKEQESDNLEEQESVEQNLDDVDEDDCEGSQYSFKLNDEGMIEVWNSETNELLKTISPESAANAMINVSKMPGVFVNKTI